MLLTQKKIIRSILVCGGMLERVKKTAGPLLTLPLILIPEDRL
jgi:hypothetical protein